MSKKTIGIVGYRNREGTSFGAGNTYLEYFSQFGNVRIIMPWEEYVEVDLLVLPGGADVNPASYGEVPRYKTNDSDVFKQYFFDHHLKNYVGKVPIFGICLGLQQLAVFFGSKLTQDIPFHEQSPVRWERAHKIIEVENPKRKEDTLPEVNSHHHQCVTIQNLSTTLVPTWIADPYIVEAFKHKELPIAAVQWHPEELCDTVALGIVKELLGEPE